ncbi:MAG TPA: tRNA pseudouridine(38-40) synthase TruA [Acidimicrobiales bacterium]|nr:tRNA pseudouridine(38-40) synthase TruA [Acidimicrobiales bacterium]
MASGSDGSAGVIRLDVAYHGAPFHGFAANEGVPTVEELLTTALVKVLGHRVDPAVAGRTDKGVHAAAQVVSFTTPRKDLDLDRLAASVTALCAPAVVVTSARWAEPDFHARFSARSRSYLYRVLNAPVADPLRSDQVWHVRHPLDVDRMNLSATDLVGENDFTSFCRRPKHPPGASLVREVTVAQWHRQGDEVRFTISANAFCHQMVRAVVGAMVEIGRGRRDPGLIAEMIRRADRTGAPSVAPPHGLVLTAVGY